MRSTGSRAARRARNASSAARFATSESGLAEVSSSFDVATEFPAMITRAMREAAAASPTDPATKSRRSPMCAGFVWPSERPDTSMTYVGASFVSSAIMGRGGAAGVASPRNMTSSTSTTSGAVARARQSTATTTPFVSLLAGSTSPSATRRRPVSSSRKSPSSSCTNFLPAPSSLVAPAPPPTASSTAFGRSLISFATSAMTTTCSVSTSVTSSSLRSPCVADCVPAASSAWCMASTAASCAAVASAETASVSLTGTPGHFFGIADSNFALALWSRVYSVDEYCTVNWRAATDVDAPPNRAPESPDWLMWRHARFNKGVYSSSPPPSRETNESRVTRLALEEPLPSTYAGR